MSALPPCSTLPPLSCCRRPPLPPVCGLADGSPLHPAGCRAAKEGKRAKNGKKKEKRKPTGAGAGGSRRRLLLAVPAWPPARGRRSTSTLAPPLLDPPRTSLTRSLANLPLAVLTAAYNLFMKEELARLKGAGVVPELPAGGDGGGKEVHQALFK